MTSRRAIAALLALSALTACDPGTMATLPRERPATPAEESLAAQCAGDAGLAAQLDAAVNAVRGAEGKTLLATSPALAGIAQSHACDMAQRGRLDVEGSNGSSVVDRARAVGYPACGVVQLVRRGGSPADAIAGWMTAAPQRTELLGQPSRQIGSGHATGADGQPYYSVVLGDNCG